MGLHVQSLDNIPLSAHRNYYVYLLDYGWYEPLSKSMYDNFDNMAAIAAQNDAVVIRGTDREHFYNEVLSWHNFNGEDVEREDLLPAILIANGHPHKFKMHEDNNLRFILIPLKKFCTTSTEVVTLVDKLFSDIKHQKDLNDFQIAKELKKGIGRALVDSLILEPNFNGIGFSFSKLINYLQNK